MRANTSRLLLAILLVFLSPLPASAEAVINGALGEWIKTESGPRLAEFISQQPRFIGESLQFASLYNGKPGPIDNLLVSQISDELRVILLRRSNIRIPIADSSTCNLNKAKITLGIEIEQQDASRHGVMLALLDTEEDIWINRSPQRWTGRLDSSQRDNLTVSSRPRIQQVFHVEETAAIARNLVAQLACQPPLLAPVFIDPALPPDTQAQITTAHRKITAQITYLLGAKTLITNKQEDANSTLRLDPPTPGPVQLGLVANHGVIALAKIDIIEKPPAPVLLSPIEIPRRKDRCVGQGAQCVDVRFDVLAPAFVFQFITQGTQMSPFSCEVNDVSGYREKTGPLQLGLKIPEGKHGQTNTLGYYVLATDNQHVASQLASILRNGSKRCVNQPSTAWIDELGEFASVNDVNFNTIHLTNARGDVRKLR